jgi:hypothetical protein
MRESGRTFDSEFENENPESLTLTSSGRPFNLKLPVLDLFESRVLAEYFFIKLQSEWVYWCIGN